MAESNEVADHLKESDHCLDIEHWRLVKRAAEAFAVTDIDDIDIPEHTPCDEDFEFVETPDEMSREETLRG